MDGKIMVTMLMSVSKEAFDRASFEAREKTDNCVDVADLVDEKLKGIFGESAILEQLYQD